MKTFRRRGAYRCTSCGENIEHLQGVNFDGIGEYLCVYLCYSCMNELIKKLERAVAFNNYYDIDELKENEHDQL